MPYRTSISTYEVVNDIFLTDPNMAVMGNYTVDENYVATTDINGHKYCKEGTVMALNPSSNKVVPNYTSYGFGVLGVLPLPVSLEDDSGEHDAEAAIVMDNAWLDEDLCKDNGTFGTVLSATKSTLSGRIVFATSLGSG